VPVKLSPSVMPGQVICYNGWDPYQFRGWTGPMDLEPGMVKWLHFAGGYGHLRYWPIQWQPTPVDRAVRVEVEKVKAVRKNGRRGVSRAGVRVSASGRERARASPGRRP